MKIASFNVNGVNGRLPRLLEWLEESRPGVACLQEVKTDDSKFPAKALEAAGYGAVWHGQRAHHGVAILARGAAPVEVRRGLPGDDADGQARYLEADVSGMRVASIYLPNGNPQPGPKFDYKLAPGSGASTRCCSRRRATRTSACTRSGSTPTPSAATPAFAWTSCS